MTTVSSFSLCDALARAVREVRPAAATSSPDELARRLDDLMRLYWGPDHGVTHGELLSTAADIRADVLKSRSAGTASRSG